MGQNILSLAKNGMMDVFLAEAPVRKSVKLIRCVWLQLCHDDLTRQKCHMYLEIISC